MLETIAETTAFFAERLQDERAIAALARRAGVTTTAASALLRRHLGVCLDACHAAVEHERAEGAVRALRDAEIPIAKVQLSAGLCVPDAADAATRRALADLAEDVYLHQVVARRGEELIRYVDLPDALASAPHAGEEWRVHFHVPIFTAGFGAFSSTQDFLVELLEEHAREPLSDHLEVETYTWAVLPAALRTASVERSIHRELTFCTDTLAALRSSP